MTCPVPDCTAPADPSGLCARHARGERRAMEAIEDGFAMDHADYRDLPWPEDRRPPVADLRRLAPIDGRGTPYGLGALRNIVLRLEAEAQHGRNNALFRAAAQAGELVAGEQLDLDYTLGVLREAAETLCPDERWKARRTVERGIEQGSRQPRRPVAA